MKSEDLASKPRKQCKSYWGIFQFFRPVDAGVNEHTVDCHWHWLQQRRQRIWQSLCGGGQCDLRTSFLQVFLWLMMVCRSSKCGWLSARDGPKYMVCLSVPVKFISWAARKWVQACMSFATFFTVTLWYIVTSQRTALCLSWAGAPTL